MVWPFKAKSFLPPEDEAWHLETWAWLLSHWGDAETLKASPLVTPTARFFPATDAQGHARAEAAFAVIKAHAQMQDWHCRLAAQPERPPAQVSKFVTLKPHASHNPAGTFGWDGAEIMITYDPALLGDSLGLVATLAHELAHYRMEAIADSVPGGPQMEEFATDLATVYLGFGLFGANRAFRFQQFQSGMSQGWSWSRQGYLQEADWVFALAVFLALRGEPAKAAKPYLRENLWSGVAKASRYLEQNPALIAPLLAVRPARETEAQRA